jgi:hypothetical protein
VGIALGQAQEQAQGARGETPAQQQPATPARSPIPVEIIGRQEAAEAREHSEAEAEQREIEDLIAQQGMNAATEAMNQATQRMAKYAFWSTVFVGVGTVLLILTLSLTRQANKAARGAVSVTREIGKKQLNRAGFAGGSNS